MSKLTELVAKYSQGFRIWMGPITPVIVFCHPDLIRIIANASGTQAELVVVGAMTHLRASSPSLTSFHVAPKGPQPPSPPLSLPSSSFLHVSIIPISQPPPSSLLPSLFTPHPGVLGERHPQI